MINFLVNIDFQGLILDIVWSDPIQTISLQKQHLVEFFDFPEHQTIETLIKQASVQTLLISKASCRLVNNPNSVTLFMTQTKDQILVFGIEDKISKTKSDTMASLSIFKRFLNYTKDLQLNQHKQSTNAMFENIQVLNNELVNSRRQLEKANAQLKVMNLDLNNHLVKDALTGLVSRYQYRAEIDLCIAQNPLQNGIFVFMDIDDFKRVNDQYGHVVGDAYLVEFANRLNHLPFSSAIKMRISGDEFGLFVYPIDAMDENTPHQLWQAIETHILNKPILIDDLRIPITISAGMACYGQDTRDVFELIDYADFAMYQAKKNGKNTFRTFNKRAFNQKNKNE